MLPLTSGLVFSTLLSTPVFLALTAIPMGGGAIAGLVQLETSREYPISTKVKSGADYVVNFFKGSDSAVPIENSQGTEHAFNVLVNAGNSISTFSESASTTISSILSNLGTYYGYANSIYPELGPIFSFICTEWETVKEILGKLGEQKEKVQNLISKMFGQRQAVIELVKKIYEQKQTYIEAANGISDKAGGGKKVMEFLLDDSLKLFDELEKVSDKLTEIAGQVEKLAKKLVSKKSDIDEIVKDIDLKTVKLEGEALIQLKSNGSHYLKKITDQESDGEDWINTLKSKKDEFKELFNNVGKDFSTYYQNQEKLSKILGMDKQEVKIKEVLKQLKDIPKDSYKNLKSIYEELTKSEVKSRLVLKSAGSGVEVLAKVIKNGESKYKPLLQSESK